MLQKGTLRWMFKDNQLHERPARSTAASSTACGSPARPKNIELPSRGIARTSVFLKLPDAVRRARRPRSRSCSPPARPKPDIADRDRRRRRRRLRVHRPERRRSARSALNELKVTLRRRRPVGDRGQRRRCRSSTRRLQAKAGHPQRRLQLRRRRGRLRQPRHRPVRPGLHPADQVPRRGQPRRRASASRTSASRPRRSSATTFTIDYGVPTFALCGEVGLTAGPSVLGATGDLARRRPRPRHLRRPPVGPARLRRHEGRDDPVRRRDVRGPHRRLREGRGQVPLRLGRLRVGQRPDLASACSARSSTPRAACKACLEFVDFCRGVNALISSKGMAVCMVIDYGIDDWRPGFGYKWGDALPDAVLLGLLARPVPRDDQRAATAGLGRRAAPSTLPAGLPGTVVAATGAGAPPKITLRRPQGRAHHDARRPDAGRGQAVLPDEEPAGEAHPDRDRRKPSAGEWKVIVEDGSAPITSLKVAHAIGRAEDRARRSPASGTQRKLAYDVEQRAGPDASRSSSAAPSTSGRDRHRRASARASSPSTPAGGAAREARDRRASSSRTAWSPTSSSSPTTARPAPAKPAQVRNGCARSASSSGLRVTWKPSGAAPATS